MTLKLKEKRQTLDLVFEKATALELKELGDDKPEGFVAGWASTPGLDTYRDVVLTGAFDEAIAERGLQGPTGIKLLIGHDWQKVGGAITKLETRKGKLWIEAQLNLNISYAKDFYEATKSSGGMNFSVGFMIQDYSFKKDDEDRSYLEIQRGDLFEVSLVPFPGNVECVMEFIKSVKEDHEADLKTGKTAADDVDFDTPPATLAEFEKRLIATGLVKDRNSAKLITLEVKSSLQLFVKKAPEPAPVANPEETEPAPLLAKESLSTINSLIERMKKAVNVQ